MAMSINSSLANKTVSQVMSRDSRYSITFNLRETYASSSENYSICSYELTATKTAGGGFYTSYFNNPVYVEINGQVVFNQNINYDFSNSTPCTITLASGTIRIPHNNNGTKNVSFSASFTDVDNALGSASINDNVDLFTIPRESSVGVSDTYIGSTATIVINKNDDSFVHTLKYSFEGLSGTIVTKTTQSVYTWTVPISFYTEIPNNKSGVCTITCQTYNGDTLIGTSTTTFRVMVDEESNKPSISAILEDVNDNTLALTGNKNVVIKYLSNVKTVITAIPKNSSTIKSYKVSCGDGKIATESTSILNAVESNYFSISSTDSRGFTTTIEKTMTMIDYIRLAFVEAVITRPETTSTTLNFSCKGNWYNGGFSSANSNTLSLKFRFKEKNGEYGSYQNLALTTNDNTFSFNGSLGSSFDYKKQYDFEILVIDKAMSAIITFNVESGQSIIRVAEHYVRIAGDLKVVGGNLYIDDKNIFDLIYPVGSIYMSIKNTNPSTLFGGTWVAWGAGRVPVGVDDSQAAFNEVEKTGGSFTKKIEKQNLPKINLNVGINGTSAVYWNNGAQGLAGGSLYKLTPDSATGGKLMTEELGSGAALDITPSYIACYMWKRTA